MNIPSGAGGCLRSPPAWPGVLPPDVVWERRGPSRGSNPTPVLEGELFHVGRAMFSAVLKTPRKN